MYTYELQVQIPGAGTGIFKEQVTAASDYNARRIVEAKYPNVQILNCRRVG